MFIFVRASSGLGILLIFYLCAVRMARCSGTVCATGSPHPGLVLRTRLLRRVPHGDTPGQPDTGVTLHMLAGDTATLLANLIHV